MPSLEKLRYPGLLALLLVLTSILYFPGLHGDFIFDDFVNIVHNEKVVMESLGRDELLQVLDSGVASSLQRPLSMLSFGLNAWFSGMEPFGFKLTNLVIHLLNSVGIYLLTLELLRIGAKAMAGPDAPSRAVALLVTACWALHPLNVSTVLYVVQRMTLLAATASIFTLLYYCRFRLRPACTQTAALLALLLLGSFTVLGVLFKENAVLVVLFILCVEVFLLRFEASNEGHRLFLKLFLWGMVVVPAVAASILLALRPEFITEPYLVRDFTVGQRLLTEARVLWIYIDWLIRPDLRELVFYYDNFAYSRSLLQPVSTLLGLLGLLGLAALVVLLRKRLPLACFGVAFFFAGHAMESSIIGLELVFEHRNYLPGFGIMLALVTSLLALPTWILRKQAVAGFLCVYAVFLAHGTWLESRKWSSTYEHLTAMIRENPDSHRLNYGMGYFLLDLASYTREQAALLDLASGFFRKAAATDGNAIRGHVGVIQADTQNGKAPDPEILEEFYTRVRTTPALTNYLTEISNLTQCWYSGFCKFDQSVLIGLYNAMASNRASNPIMIQGMLDQIGTAAAYVFKRPQDALAILSMARDLRPDLTLIDIKLIHIEVEMGRKQEALARIAEARAEANAAAFEDLLVQMEKLAAAIP